jgi:dihydrofolate reductase
MSATSKVIVYIAVSLDGFIAKKEGDISWLEPANLPQEDYGYSQFMETVDTVIMGRKTYEKILTLVDEFPHQDKHCYVLSRQAAHEKDAYVTFYQGDITNLVNKLKSNTTKNIYIDGGAEVIHALRQESLIDEYILFITPILLGSGIPLWKEIQVEERLIFLGSQTYLSGYVRLHYQTKK